MQRLISRWGFSFQQLLLFIQIVHFLCYEDTTSIILVKGKVEVKKGSSKPGHDVAGSVGDKVVKEVYEEKKEDITAASLEAGMRTIEGSVRSMGLKLDY